MERLRYLTVVVLGIVLRVIITKAWAPVLANRVEIVTPVTDPQRSTECLGPASHTYSRERVRLAMATSREPIRWKFLP